MRHYSMTFLGMSLLSMALSSAAYAMGEGFYLGAEAGKTWQHNQKKDLQTGEIGTRAGTFTANPDNTGVGGRIFIGYQMNHYFGTEMGFAHYAPTTYNIPYTTTPQLSFGNPVGNPAITANALDFTGKGILPIAESGFDVFGKLGVAIIRVSTAGTFNQTYATTSSGIITSTILTSTSSTNYFKPLAGIGISYDFTQNWQAQLSGTRIFGGGGFQPVDLVSLGLSYHFVDKYCGQFLC